MIEDIVGSNGTRFIIAAGAVALGLLCLVGVLWFIRNRPSSPFIRGGKNRQPRLAVLDAAAIDTRRRLVLVRRDDVEHLIMIGGPTDVVIESRIATPSRPMPQATATAPDTTAGRAMPERRVQPQPQPEPGAAPVSAMGQVLYGEDTGTVAGATPAPPARTRSESVSAAVPAARQPLPEQRRPVTETQRPQTVASIGVPPVATENAKSPEDILEAARNRVLAANQTTAQPRPIEQTPTAVAARPQAPQDTKDPTAAEFERILDAEISGDLGKLTAEDVRVDGDRRTAIPSPGTAIRQEPRLGSAPSGRTEPTLEDEMNRMLNEIAVSRKG